MNPCWEVISPRGNPTILHTHRIVQLSAWFRGASLEANTKAHRWSKCERTSASHTYTPSLREVKIQWLGRNAVNLFSRHDTAIVLIVTIISLGYFLISNWSMQDDPAYCGHCHTGQVCQVQAIQVWWHMPLSQALGGYPGLHREFQASQEYTVRPSQNKQTKRKKTEEAWD